MQSGSINLDRVSLTVNGVMTDVVRTNGNGMAVFKSLFVKKGMTVYHGAEDAGTVKFIPFI